MTEQKIPDSLKIGPGPVAVPAAPAAVRDNFKGVIWALISVFGASLMTLAVRGVTLELDSRMAVMFRAGFASVLILLALVLWAGLRQQMQFSKPWSHVIRGGLIGVSTNLGFYTLAHIPLATATVLFSPHRFSRRCWVLLSTANPWGHAGSRRFLRGFWGL